ncbi:MAG: VOC family protein [Fimbriimonadaceae bacterium]|nr:VOC family protein [Fimbriimonadaceae bacterium]QYK56952.1 MAG: VOC family protein [Fimbriimonadaceae bacterium]
MEPGVSLDTVFVRVRDIAASTAFYRDVLGLEISSQSDYWTSSR